MTSAWQFARAVDNVSGVLSGPFFGSSQWLSKVRALKSSTS
jgi:hypothetical protein